MSAAPGKPLRIGEVAELTGTTPRTIRYYEEIGLLPGTEGRELGQHRLYGQADVDRVREIVRLRDLLGLSLEQLSRLLEAESARAELRREFHASEDPGRRRAILGEALELIDDQLGLVRARCADLERLEQELQERRVLVRTRLGELQG